MNFITAMVALLASTQVWAAVHIYSSRKEHLIKPLIEAYEKKTGEKIELLTDKAPALLQRLRAEQKKPRADLFVTVDAGNLWYAAEQGFLGSAPSKALEKNIPAHLRDKDNRWFGLSVRARTIVYSKDRVKTA